MPTKLKDVFKEIKDFLGDDILALETGISTAFFEGNEDNLSTPNIVEYLLTTEDSSLLSIDIDDDAIKTCKENMGEKLNKVNIVADDSIYFMNQLLRIKKQYNFFWLDSSEDIEHGLKEYQLALSLAKRPFVICIDDYNANGSVKWRASAEELKKDSSYWEEKFTATGLIVGYFK